jgi:hypothetical protein
MIHPARKNIKFFGLGSAAAAPLLYSYIATHPGLSVPETETGFFSDTDIYKLGTAWYESQFDAPVEGVIHGELSLGYLKSAVSAGLIARTYPSAKLLAVIENPLVSVRVEYVKARRSGPLRSNVTLAQFLKQYPEVLEQARYGRQLLSYFNYYSPNDLLILTAAEVRENPLAVIKQVYEHLGLDAKFVPAALRHLVIAEEDPVKHKPGIIKRSFGFLKKLVVGVFSSLKGRYKTPEVAVETASNVARSLPLSPELEQYLKNFYRQDVATLSDLVKRSLSAEWDI